MLKSVRALALLLALGFGLAMAQTPTTAPSVVGTITTQNLVAAGTCTTGGCVEVDVRDKGSLTVQVTGTYTGALSGQITTDGTTWVTLGGSTSFTLLSSGATSATITSGSTGIYQVTAIPGSRGFRIAALAAVTGTANVTIQTSSVPPPSSTTISGGAGDASAANQVTGNASLASIDGKLSALGTQAIAASVSVTPATSSTWPVSASSLPLPTGAATAAKQPALGTAGASSTDVISVQGIASGTALPVSGTVAATQSGTWTARVQDGSGNAITSAARGAERAVSVQIVDASGAQVTSFGGSGGTASNFGSAVPSAGTAMGASDGTNMQNPRVADIDTGAGTQYALVTSMRLGASGGGVELTGGAGAVAAGTLRVTQASDSPLVSATGATNETAPASDTATSGLNGRLQRIAQNLTTQTAAINADPNYSGVITAATAPTRMLLSGGVFNTSLPTLTNGQSAAAQFDSSGRLIVNVGAGGGSGGTSSSFGAAIPATGTAAGFSDGTNMQLGRVYDTDSGAGTQYTAGVSLRKIASGGSVEFGTSTDPIRTDPTGTTTQPISGTVSITANSAVNVSQINGVTPLMGAGNTGTGSHRVTLATDQAAIATAGQGATGAAVPSGATQIGVRTGANMEAVTQGSTSVAINVSTATTTQLVALSGSTQIRVTGLTVVAGGTGNITFVYGTGSNCGTGTTSISGAIPLVANVGFTMGAGLGPVLIIPASQALCITTSAAVQMSGWLTYAQY